MPTRVVAKEIDTDFSHLVGVLDEISEIFGRYTSIKQYKKHFMKIKFLEHQGLFLAKPFIRFPRRRRSASTSVFAPDAGSQLAGE